MNQQHSETEEEIKARIRVESNFTYPIDDTYSSSDVVDAIVRRQAHVDAALPRELEIAFLRAELTALREKTVEMVADAWEQSRKATKDNGSSSSIMWKSARTAHLDALRSKINSSYNKG